MNDITGPDRKWTVRDLAGMLNQLIEDGRGDHEVCVSFAYEDLIPEQHWRALNRYDFEPFEIGVSPDDDYFITIRTRQQPEGPQA